MTNYQILGHKHEQKENRMTNIDICIKFVILYNANIMRSYIVHILGEGGLLYPNTNERIPI